jgi:cardiolipin synthase
VHALTALQKTFSRYWDFSIPSAEVRPTQISKYNTALQLGLMFSTAVAPVIPHDLSLPLTGLQYVVFPYKAILR